MAFFGLFKKKDDFDSLKDPLSDPFGKMPDMNTPPSQFPNTGFQSNPFQSNTQSQELPPFDMPGMQRDNTDSDPFSSQNGQNNYAASMGQNNYNTSAAPLPSSTGGFESTYPPRKNKGPEVFEEMQNPYQQPQQKQTSDSSFDRRDFEILNSKLDTIKSQLESLSSRLVNLEKKPYEEETTHRPRRYNW